jgi:hypothetical protein
MRTFAEIVALFLVVLCALGCAWQSWIHYRRRGDPPWFCFLVSWVTFVITGSVFFGGTAMIAMYARGWINRIPPSLSILGDVDGLITQSRLEQTDYNDMSQIFCIGALDKKESESIIVLRLRLKPVLEPDQDPVPTTGSPEWWNPQRNKTSRLYQAMDYQGTSEVKSETWVMITGNSIWIEQSRF